MRSNSDSRISAPKILGTPVRTTVVFSISPSQAPALPPQEVHRDENAQSNQGYDQQNGRFEHRRRGTLNLLHNRTIAAVLENTSGAGHFSIPWDLPPACIWTLNCAGLTVIHLLTQATFDVFVHVDGFHLKMLFACKVPDVPHGNGAASKGIDLPHLWFLCGGALLGHVRHPLGTMANDCCTTGSFNRQHWRYCESMKDEPSHRGQAIHGSSE